VGSFPSRSSTICLFHFSVGLHGLYASPAPLAEPADLAITYVPRPEWFFFYEQMLMFFPGYALIAFGAVVVPTVFIVLLLAVPWLDRAEGVLDEASFRDGGFWWSSWCSNMLMAVSRIINFRPPL